ncbi:MAG: AMP-binding protein [Lautropia sp.]|nr:AMP-binding protein [Lautropia sp.]
MASAARTPQADFLYIESVTAGRYGIPPGAVSWKQAADRVACLRAAYSRAGYGHGHRVGLLLENRPEFFFHWLALNELGVSVVPINFEMRSAELAYLIGHSEIGLVVTLPERREMLARAATEAERPLRLAVPSDPSFPTALLPAPKAGQRVGRDTECALLYTSGTTGKPKGCVLDNAYFLRAGQWYASLGGLSVYRADQERVMTPLPLNHMNAMAFSAVVVMLAGGCLVQLDRFHPGSWLNSARESGASIIHYLGVMPAMLLAAPPAGEDRLHDIRWGFGAGVGADHHAVFEARFGFPLIEAWAMTETGAAACIMANHEPRQVGRHCFGKPEDFVDIRIVAEDGSDVEPGAPGELLVRSAGPSPRQHFFRGYLKDEAATEEAWQGGWFRTGDIVRQDDEGRMYFVDRKKNVIRRSGENISAVEVEGVLSRHPAVKAVAVTATPDSVRGDEVLACVVLNDGVSAADPDRRQALARSIVDHALDRLAYYKAPGYVAFVKALPLTMSQKVQRGELRQMGQALPGTVDCVDTRTMKKRRD